MLCLNVRYWCGAFLQLNLFLRTLRSTCNLSLTCLGFTQIYINIHAVLKITTFPYNQCCSEQHSLRSPTYGLLNYVSEIVTGSNLKVSLRDNVNFIPIMDLLE